MWTELTPCLYVQSKQNAAWAPPGTGKKGHLPPPPSGNVVKCFCVLVVTAKHPRRWIIYALFSQPVVSFGAPSLDPAGGLVPDPKPLIFPPLEKNPAGADETQKIYTVYRAEIWAFDEYRWLWLWSWAMRDRTRSWRGTHSGRSRSCRRDRSSANNV